RITAAVLRESMPSLVRNSSVGVYGSLRRVQNARIDSSERLAAQSARQAGSHTAYSVAAALLIGPRSSAAITHSPRSSTARALIFKGARPWRSCVDGLDPG